MCEVEVRPATEGDAPALAGLLGELGHPTSAEEVVRRLPLLRTGGDEVLVATRGGEVIGLVSLHACCLLHRPQRLGRITSLVIRESERGAGAGALLIAAAERWALGQGCGHLEVTSHNRRGRAHSFYERCGFERSHQRLVKTLGG